MIDHVSVAVSDLQRAADFYDNVLGPLGHLRLETRIHNIGFGKRYPEFWINQRGDMRQLDPQSGAHIAFRAANKAAVDAFHAAALNCGGACDGPPGLRPQHGDGYYAAFIRDPDGNRIEAVTFLTDGI
jgi:catechol 2,3-dioxygenase-like lactoylglutathione lyase family enzyme